jgi:hypothetical protein
MQAPESARKVTEGAPRVQKIAFQIILDHFVCTAIEEPEVPVGCGQVETMHVGRPTTFVMLR